jgi:hypothetical protein
MSRRQAPIETVLVFAVFFLQGAWPVPEVNEPYYLAKAIHFWNPSWAAGDFFLETVDTHRVFYWTLGWLSLWLPPTPLAWTLRLITWALLAWAWRRLSVALVPRPWCAPLSAAIFVFLLQHFAMAGEWVVGGAEAKGFAYVMVLLGLEALVRGRWSRTWLWLGAATAMHVLVGGWSAIAAGGAWFFCRIAKPESPRIASGGQHLAQLNGGQARPLNVPSLRSMAPALAAGLLLAATGLVPAIALDWQVDAATARAAHEIYVFERLSHHLDPFSFPAGKFVPFLLLTGLWLLLAVGEWRKAARVPAAFGPPLLLTGFVQAAIVIALLGLALRVIGEWNRSLAAGLLRFYWFRLSDVAVPLGVALLAVGRLAGFQEGIRLPAARFRRACLAATIFVAALHEADCAVVRLFASPPADGRARDERLPDPAAWERAGLWLAGRSERPIFPRQPRADRLADFRAWKEACTWVAESGEIPASARFLTPRVAQTFKWYAGRGEVGTLKEMPQDAAGLVRWWRRLEDLHATGLEPPDRWYISLAEQGAGRLRQLAARYDAQYAITEATEPPLSLPVVFQNRSYIIYRLP